MHQTKRGIGGFKAWCVCLCAGLFFFYEFIQLNIFDVLNPLFRNEFALDASQLSLLSSAFLWANVLFLLPAGLLLDHFSVRRVVHFTLLICILGTIGLACSQGFPLMFLGRFLTGIGNAFCFLASVILVSRWFPHSRQGLVMGLLVTLAFIGGMMAHTPFTYLISHYGWRQALWMDVLLGGFIWGVLFWQIQDTPEGWTTSHQARKLDRNFLNVLRSQQTYAAGAYTALLNLPVMVLCALWGGSYLKTVYGLSAIQASQVVSCLFLGSMLGCPLLGWLSDSLRRRKMVMWLGVVGTLLSLTPLFVQTALGMIGLISIFFAIGFFTSAQVISYPLIAESQPPHLVGEATSVASMIIMGSGALGQMLFGALMQHRAGMTMLDYSPDHFQYAMLMFPAAVIIAGFILVGIRETNCMAL